MKGFIQLTTVATGLSVDTITQLLSVSQIDSVMDVSSLTDDDRDMLDVVPSAKTLIIAKGIAEDACEVTESFDEVLTLIEDAS